ncbi:hypothetical protein B296_00006642 [Ensete ventricosum]|uniref:Uncharacterized protein n=1 Tax=Ensete ventricosum TaxID=4639 RepID=A0A427ABX0_ENSVE|nr:hypothetical protein B296_00006642 [Ensete ventricosum]
MQPTSSLPAAASLLAAPFRRFYCTCYNCRLFFLNTSTRLQSFLCFTSQSLPCVLRRPTSIRSQRHSSSSAASSSSPPAQAAPSFLSNDSLSSSCGVLSSAPACLKLVPRSAQSRCLLLFLLVELFPHLLPQKLDFRRAFGGDRRTSSSLRRGLLRAGTSHCIFNLHSYNSINQSHAEHHLSGTIWHLRSCCSERRQESCPSSHIRLAGLASSAWLLHEAVFLVLHRYRIILNQQRHFRDRILSSSIVHSYAACSVQTCSPIYFITFIDFII